MGLLKDGINEVIATTTWNAAPMGIICREKSPKMVVFRGSHTAENISRDGWVVANFIFDPVIYVETAFGDLQRDHFVTEKVAGFSVQRLHDAEAWAAYSAEISRETDEAYMVELTPLYQQMLTCAVHPVNRGFSSIIEATVHATRFAKSGDPALEMWIMHHSSIVQRCGGKREREALALLQRYIKKERGD